MQDRLQSGPRSDGEESAIDFDVLVVGGGPVGILAAADLFKRGLKVKIIDFLTEPVKMTKASGIQTRSLELLPPSVVQDIQAYGVEVSRAVIQERTPAGVKKVLSINMKGLSDTYQGLHAQEQHKTEEMLNKYMAGLGLQVERGIKLKSLQEVPGGVQCVLEDMQKKEESTLRVRYVLGCDGGRSTVRKQLGVDFAGETMEEAFMALHCSLNGYVEEGNDVTVVNFSKGDGLENGMCFAMSLPAEEPGCNGVSQLIVLDLDTAQEGPWLTGDSNAHGVKALRKPTPEELVDILRKRGMGDNLEIIPGSVKWCTSFRINSRMAEVYNKGHVFLAGDACHCHSPLGGQGMNMGFQDALNVSWKMAFVIQRELEETKAQRLLATYNDERRSTDEKICKAIEKGAHAASSRNPVVFFMRGRGQRLAGLLPFLHGKAVTAVNQQVHSYKGGPLAVEHWERPPPIPCPISRLCPVGGYRRQQNLYRWLGARVRAGDRVPAFPLPDGQALYPYTAGWMLLLFEGHPEDNEAQEVNLSNVQPLSVSQLQQLGDELQAMGLVDTVIVLAGHEPAHEIFNVHGQCLFLVRPDAYVALRSEPARKGAVVRYFRETLGCTSLLPTECPRSDPVFDWLPPFVWLVLGSCITAAVFFAGELYGKSA